MTRLLLLLLLGASSAAHAIVIRDDVDDAEYRIPAAEFPALVDMPGDGHGTLIAPRWAVTAAHTIPLHFELKQVVINGIPRRVERVVIHPGYKALPQSLIDQAMASGEAVLIVTFLASSDDIALIELTDRVTDVAPVALYGASDEHGQVVKIVGKGRTSRPGRYGHAACNARVSHYIEWIDRVVSEQP
ncbi:trypsin-like serine protease [Luteimonas sp. SJ-92]|uniref:Trypsin-like serine protease n=1 Tax=Luteimonas salinisoli TaxID=2752307 RepID=A0A853JEQ0_9GAMM|nr:trypsin-like serine protease [Luteimonas salinisoli]NZA27803.1 trypsin-like serine protease [Luteimonas salinisoli]